MRAILLEMWTAKQRMVLAALILILWFISSLRLIQDDETVPRKLPDVGPRANEVMSQLDLNTADAAALSAIPRLGIAKAQAIVDYRQKFELAHPGQRPFERMDDLFRIKGVGVSTMAQLREYAFISKPAATKQTK